MKRKPVIDSAMKSIKRMNEKDIEKYIQHLIDKMQKAIDDAKK